MIPFSILGVSLFPAIGNSGMITSSAEVGTPPQSQLPLFCHSWSKAKPVQVRWPGLMLAGPRVTVLVTKPDVPQPVLRTFIVTPPDQLAGQVTTPVVELMAEASNVPFVLLILVNDHSSVPTVAVLL